MAAVSETIVREYFELHGFLVQQRRKFVTPTRREEEEVDFLVYNPHAREPAADLPFTLGSNDLERISRAVVVVKGWHTETFGPGMLASSPEIFRSVTPSAFKQAAKALGGDGSLVKILVVPALPHGAEAREKSIQLLRSKGIDCVIPFRTMLADLVDRIEVNRNYQKADLLQIIRILKNYDFLKGPQLDLFKPKRKRKSSAGKSGHAADIGKAST